MPEQGVGRPGFSSPEKQLYPKEVCDRRDKVNSLLAVSAARLQMLGEGPGSCGASTPLGGPRAPPGATGLTSKGWSREPQGKQRVMWMER